MANTINTTTTAPAGFSPDVVAFTAEQAIPDALLLKASTVVNTDLEGDRPSVLVPWVKDSPATWTGEGMELTGTAPELDQVAIPVRKMTKLCNISREMWEGNGNTNSTLLSNGAMRSIIKTADSALMTVVEQASFPLDGLVNTEGRVEGGNITTNLDPLADAIGQVEANGGTPSLIVAHPLAWSKLRNLKATDASNTTLLGAGTEDQGKKLFGIEVITNAAVPEDTLVVIDPTAIVSAAGQVEVATSDQVLFNYDSIALRVIWHMGWKVMEANRLATVTVGASTGK